MPSQIQSSNDLAGKSLANSPMCFEFNGLHIKVAHE